MAVYVDAAFIRYGRMTMCHLLADSRAELDAMADRIGVARRWIQHADTPKEHYDICLAARRKALAAGAIVVTRRALVALLRARRSATPVAPPGSGPAPITGPGAR